MLLVRPDIAQYMEPILNILHAAGPGKALHFAVFEKLNQLPERPFVAAERVREIEIYLILAAYGALTVMV